MQGNQVHGSRYLRKGQVHRYLGEPVGDREHQAAQARIAVPLWQRPEMRQQARDA